MAEENALKNAMVMSLFHLSDLSDQAHWNETAFTGWGEQTVPQGAIDFRIAVDKCHNDLVAAIEKFNA